MTSWMAEMEKTQGARAPYRQGASSNSGSSVSETRIVSPSPSISSEPMPAPVRMHGTLNAPPPWKERFL